MSIYGDFDGALDRWQDRRLAKYLEEDEFPEENEDMILDDDLPEEEE
jgi:hypothetical protein